MRQLALPLAVPPGADGDLFPDASNLAARTWLARTADWPGHRLALWGPEGVGKSHLLRGLAAARGWRRLCGPALRGVPEPAPSVLDDADCPAEETALFHLINACAAAGAPLLLAGRQPPARWQVAVPDLRSRLRATHAVAIAEPSDELLRALLARHFAERQLRVDGGVQAWLLARLPRQAAAVAEAAARLDRAALTRGGAVTRGLARTALAELLAPEPEPPAHDVSMEPVADPSTAAPRLL